MRTSLAFFALLVTEDCDAAQAWQVRFWSATAITALSLQFGVAALAAVVGSFVGMAMIQLASQGARELQKTINENSVHGSKVRAESVAVKVAMTASAARRLECLLQKSFCAVVATFAALGISHVSLANLLFPYPVLRRA